MAVYWYLFWSGFTVFYLAKILISKDVFYDDGSGTSGTHIWVRPGSTYKVRDATHREVWNRENPGKSWHEHAKKGAVGCSVVLAIFILVLLLGLAYWRVFSLPVGWLPILIQVGAFILGVALAVLVIFLQSRIVEYRSDSERNFNVIILILLAVCLVVLLVLTLFRVDLPMMQYWPWLFLGTWFRNFLAGGLTEKDLDRIAEREAAARKKQSAASGAKLVHWAEYVMGFMHDYNRHELARIMKNAVVKLQRGELDKDINELWFFQETEAVILDFINSSQSNIEPPELHGARDQVLMAAQMFYLYSASKFPGFRLHPKIEALINK